jgi:hypothetical protein
MCLVFGEGCAAATLWLGAVEATCLLSCAFNFLILLVSWAVAAADSLQAAVC